MEINTETLEQIKQIKQEITDLNNLIDKKCLDIYNENEKGENKINMYTNYMETIILEYHKICKTMFVKK